MEKLHILQSHPRHTFSEEDPMDYSEQDKHFVQCLKSMENLMDINAYIIDYKNKRILYATKGCSVYFSKDVNDHDFLSLQNLDNIISVEEIPRITLICSKVYDFCYSLPKKRRLKCYFTLYYKIKTRNGNTFHVNHKETVLSLTEDGTLRLTLCVINYSTSDKKGNAYIKMVDTGTVYEFMPITQKFVEVKTQKLTSKASQIIKMASDGKTEAEIATELGISINTVKYHKKQIFARIGVKNTAEAIQWMNNQKKMVKMTRHR